MSLHARLSGPADAALLHRLHGRIFSPPTLGESYWQGERDTPPALCVLIERDAEAIAYCDGYVAGGEGDIVSIGTAPEARGQGAGGLALRAFLEAAAARGAERISLEVGAGNAAAQRLYRRFGFEEAGRRRAYYADGSDALIFSRADRLAAGSGRD